jgi:hypothetical protein
MKFTLYQLIFLKFPVAITFFARGLMIDPAAFEHLNLFWYIGQNLVKNFTNLSFSLIVF